MGYELLEALQEAHRPEPQPERQGHYLDDAPLAPSAETVPPQVANSPLVQIWQGKVDGWDCPEWSSLSGLYRLMGAAI